MEILGRIAAVRAPSRIEILHDQPWRGRLRLRFDADGSRTRVRLFADLDDSGLAWLVRRRGHRLADPPDRGAHPVGLLLSKSGPGSVFAVACENLAATTSATFARTRASCGAPVSCWCTR